MVSLATIKTATIIVAMILFWSSFILSSLTVILVANDDTNLDPPNTALLDWQQRRNRRHRMNVPDLEMHPTAGKFQPFRQNENVRRIHVAYAISITSCPTVTAERPTNNGLPPFGPSVWDGPAVLAQSIRDIHSSERISENQSVGDNNISYEYNYGYTLYAFVLPSAAEEGCASSLESLGYTVLVRDIPFDVNAIKNEDYKRKIETNGCCGSKEFLKLLAYALDGSDSINQNVRGTNDRIAPKKHDIVVHVDTDSFFVKPLNLLFDAMLESSSSSARTHRNRLLSTRTVRKGASEKQIDIFYTRDYLQENSNAVRALADGTDKDFRYTSSWLPIQGGFFIVQPNHTVLSAMVDTILEGTWYRSRKHGGFWGGYQIQGFLSYWYSKENDWRRDERGQVSNNSQSLHSHRSENSIELDPCRFNTMTHDNKNLKQRDMKGYDIQHPVCETTPMDQIFSVHLTKCRKPWECPLLSKVHPQMCIAHHRKWFELRQALEIQWNRTVPTDGWHFERTLGYCRRGKVPPRKRKYVPLGPAETSYKKG